MSAGPLHNQIVLFTCADVEAICERCAQNIIRRNMPAKEAWRAAMDDQIALIGHKLDLMQEGSMEWDLPSRQLAVIQKTLKLT